MVLNVVRKEGKVAHIGWAPMVTHRFALDDVAQAFEVATSTTGGAIEVLVEP